MAWLSIRGLYLYNSDLFNGLSLPSGMSKSVLVGRILQECAELEVIYPDWDTMADAIKWWSLSNSIGWNRAWTVLRQSYDPLWNVDATITDTETRDLKSTDNRTGSGSGTDKSVTKEDGTNELDVNAYNDGSWQDRERNTVDNDTTSTLNRTYSDTDKRSGTDTGTVKHETRRTGNIGVTSSQELLLKEMEVAEINLYDRIVQDFKRRFCLLVY